MADLILGGQRIPAELAPRVLAAIRGLYPSVTEGMNDKQAVAAWIKYVITATLANWEGNGALVGAEEAAELARREFQAKAIAAREKAKRDADAISEA